MLAASPRLNFHFDASQAGIGLDSRLNRLERKISSLSCKLYFIVKPVLCNSVQLRLIRRRHGLFRPGGLVCRIHHDGRKGPRHQQFPQGSRLAGDGLVNDLGQQRIFKSVFKEFTVKSDTFLV